MTNFDRCQEIHDNATPSDEPTCPECGSDDVDIDKYSFSCNDCEYSNSADLDDILENGRCL